MLELEAGGVRIGFTFGFFFTLAVSALADYNGITLWALLAIAIHECGHIAALCCCGSQARAMTFSCFGIRLYKQGLMSYQREIAVYLGGVAANAAACAVCAVLLMPDGLARLKPILFAGAVDARGRLTLLMWLNIFLICFNLIPVGRLDGGVLLRLLLIRAGMWEHAQTVCRAVGLILLAPLFCAGLWMAARQSFALLFTSVYLAAGLLGDSGDI